MRIYKNVKVVWYLYVDREHFNPIALTNIYIKHLLRKYDNSVVGGDIGRSYKSRPCVTIEKRSFSMSLLRRIVSFRHGEMLYSYVQLLFHWFHVKITSFFFIDIVHGRQIRAAMFRVGIMKLQSDAVGVQAVQSKQRGNSLHIRWSSRYAKHWVSVGSD